MTEETRPATLEETEVVALQAPKKISESRKRFDEVVQREIQDAIERKQFEVAEAMAAAGVPINEFPDTEEGLQQLHAWMTEHEVTIDKLVYQDNFKASGTYVKRSGILVAFVPCEIVRGVMV